MDLLTRIMSVPERLADWLFGYDLFVAYRQEAAGAYAAALQQKLQQGEPVFSVFRDLDPDGFVAGGPLDLETERAVRSSTALLALVDRTAFAEDSVYMPQEVLRFQQSDRLIVPIDLEGCLRQARHGADVRSSLPRSDTTRNMLDILLNRINIEETSFATAAPSAVTLAKLRGSLNIVTRSRRRIGALIALALFLFGLVLVAGVLAILERKARRLAEKETRIATSREYAALSESERNRHLDLSLLLASEAVQAPSTLEARASLYRALQARPGLISFLHMNEDSVYAVAFSSDDKVVAAGYGKGQGGGVVLWDAETRKRIRDDSLTVSEGGVHCVAFDPRSSLLAAGYDDGRHGGGIVLWDLGGGRPTRIWEDRRPGPGGGVGSIAFDPDRKTLVAVLTGGGVVQWDIAKRKCLADAPPPDTSLSRVVAVSPTGKSLALGDSFSGGRGRVEAIEISTGRRLACFRLEDPEGSVQHVALGPDQEFLAAGYTDGVALWKVDTRNRVGAKSLRVPEGAVECVALSRRYLAAGYKGGEVVLWLASSQKRISGVPLRVTEGDVKNLAFGNKTLAAAFQGETGKCGVTLWDIDGLSALGNEPLSASGPLSAPGRIENVAFSRDGQYLAAGRSNGGGVALWHLEDGTWVDVSPPPSNKDVKYIAFSPDRTTLAGGCESGEVKFWNVASSKELPGEPIVLTGSDVGGLAFSPDGKVLVAGYSDGRGGGVVLLDPIKRRRYQVDPLLVPEAGKKGVRSVAFNADGSFLAAGSEAGVVLWDAVRLTRLGQHFLPAPKVQRVRCVGFSPSRRLLAAGCDNGDVVIWMVPQLKPLAEHLLGVPWGDALSLSFGPRGEFLATGFLDSSGRGGVMIWDVPTRKNLLGDVFPVEGVLRVVAFSPDRKTLAVACDTESGSKKDVVKLWDVDLESWKRRAGLIANRNLTWHEWQRYFPEEPSYRRTFPDLPCPTDLPKDQGRKGRQEKRFQIWAK
jgi:WD40 repeat protein